MSNLKISQLEKITNMKEDSFVLAVQNGKNYKMSVKEAMNSYIDLSNYYTKEETVDTITELQNSITSNTDLINTTKTELQNSITSNTDLINATKTELIGTENTGGTTIWGAKKYTDDLVKNLSSRIDSIVAGGVAFKGVVAALPSPANNGDLVIMSADYEIGGKTYKKDYEYIYSNGTWYELGDSDKNAKAIATVESKTNSNTNAISALDTAYKAADSDLESKINVIGIALIGDNTDGSDADTIWGAKNYATGLVSALVNSFVAITDEEINGLFTV